MASDTSPAEARPGQSTGTVSLVGVLMAGGLGLLAVLAVYLALAAPGRWFGAAPSYRYAAGELAVVRGNARRETHHIEVASDTEGTILLSATGDFRADRYLGVEWLVSDLPEAARARILWRSDIAPQRVSSAALSLQAGHVLPVLLADNSEWVGHVKGVALLVQTAPGTTIAVRGLNMKSFSAQEALRDRAAEWLQFEPWTGTSILSVTGGSDVQSLPLPVLAACAVLAAIAMWLMACLLSGMALQSVLTAAAIVFLGWWLVLDARWEANLARQATRTVDRYMGRDFTGKHLAAEDGDVFAFAQKVKRRLPSHPGRVFVASEAAYFRGRLAYYLYPHDVFHFPLRNSMPPVQWLQHGDWIVVYRRPGVEYDAAIERLRWEADSGGVKVHAALSEGDGALFEVD